MTTPLSRRDFVRKSALAAAATAPLTNLLANADTHPAATAGEARRVEDTSRLLGSDLRWLEGSPPKLATGVTWGVPWSRGEQKADATFQLTTADGKAVPVQSWPLAYWPDGSAKWTAHAAVVGADGANNYALATGDVVAAAPRSALKVQEDADTISIETGAWRCVVGRSGSDLIRTIEREGRVLAKRGRLVGSRQDGPTDSDISHPVRQYAFTSSISTAVVEMAGPIRAVVKVEGFHLEENGRKWLPFTVRFYFSADSEIARLVHTFVFDGDENRDFLRSLGVRFEVPMRDAPHDRHIRFAGEGRGIWGEATRPLTGLRRDAGTEARTAQVAGRATPSSDTFPPQVKTRLELIPAWGDFSLSQLSADGFQVQKRTKGGHGWIAAGAGKRAGGMVYVGGPSGGLAVGQRFFWERHPTQLDVRNATTDTAEVTSWLWSPTAPAMDIRFYHDGLGMDTYPEQLSGMEITYEDFEPGFGSPYGVARTNEFFIWPAAATPSREALADFTETLRTPPLLVVSPERLQKTGVFADMFLLEGRSGATAKGLEERQNFLIDFYLRQIEQRRWYGFWDHGDVMHTYDADRHVWRYDIGGFAWDNSELSPDLWLWLSYLRSGRADVFRFAEAMTRHTGEVDVHHIGRFAGLGSRHNVMHWGCSAKQVRVSNAAYRRYYYYLTGDERVGDLLRELRDSQRSYLTLLATRKVSSDAPRPPGPNGKAVYMGVGTDWGSVAAAWLAEWERTGDAKYRDRLLTSMRTIAALPGGFFAGGGVMDIETGAFSPGPSRENRERLGVSHLNSVFGLVEVCAELIALEAVPEFERAWLDYCELYNAPAEEQVRRLGKPIVGNGLTQGHSRLTAYAGHRLKNDTLKERAWAEFFSGRGEQLAATQLKTTRIDGPDSLTPVDEATWVSTNAASQWGLAMIQLLAWAGPPKSV